MILKTTNPDEKVEFTTVKVPAPTYKATKILQAQIAKRGIENLPSDFRNLVESESCPLCYNQMQQVGQGYNLVRCPKCGFSKHALKMYSAEASDMMGLISMGALIGLGIAALAEMLKKSK